MDKISIGIQVVWKISAKEALSTGFSEIEPEHFFIGILKLADVINRIDTIYPSLKPFDTAEVIKEVAPVRQAFSDSGYDITYMRRSFRDMIRQNDIIGNIEVIHRSERSKNLFEQLFNIKYSINQPNIQHLTILILESPNKRLSLLFERISLNRSDLVNKIRSKLIVKEKENTDYDLLSKIGRNLSQLASEGKLTLVIGREKEIRDLGRALLQKRKKNAILIGEAGVGKTAVVEGLAQTIYNGSVPDILKSKIIIEVTISNIVAGTKYRGEFEEKMKMIIDELKKNNEIVLFIDEIHTIVGAGSAEGSLDVSNIIKPAMSRGEIQLIGATTIKEYRKYIEKDSALQRRFQVIKIEEPDRSTTLKILHGIKHNFEKHYNVKISDNAIEQAVDLSIRYLSDNQLPDKAIDVIEKACTLLIFPSVLNLNFKRIDNGKPEYAYEINEVDIRKAVSKICNIPLENLTNDEKQRFLKMEEYISERVIGQNEAVNEICETLRIAKSGLKAPGKPIGVFLLVGPTGVGKTEMAKATHAFLFNDNRKLIRFDMSEYMEKHQISRLIGAPPGYIGHDEEGQLIQQVRNNPYSVVLFDEIEKAHPDIYPIFLQIFDEGTLTGSHGIKANFKESIIILTSNLGSDILKEKDKIDIGFLKRNLKEDFADFKLTYKNAIINSVQNYFAPELINRIQKIVVFYPLENKDIEKIVDRQIYKLQDRLLDRNIYIELDVEAKLFLIEKGYNRLNGVRHLERIIDKEIITKLGKLILEKDLKDKIIRVVKNNGILIFKEISNE